MRYIKRFILFFLIIVALIFALQNYDIVTISFLKWQKDLSLTLTIVLTYILGAISGGLLFSMFKSLVKSGKKKT
ncbi:lipopolysaccharide assembly protein LapA domain-containing protein [Membranihabitans maritimus]|uniref:lipopolysaccharide assembly protein LapA domain-containing protein n=1 Tax=Membranihabitans maritimus TaxID=2904244 RepID=UPI001F002311|nr:lipopolysaccharide assembly protein LapA domain-containing protein [Membranihabitans maritimus]